MGVGWQLSGMEWNGEHIEFNELSLEGAVNPRWWCWAQWVRRRSRRVKEGPWAISVVMAACWVAA